MVTFIPNLLKDYKRLKEEKMVIDQNQKSQMNVNINLDTTPILYTDNVLVSGSEDGIVLDFCQKVGPTNQVRVVSRIGMSREHAQKLLKVLTDQLRLSEGQVQTNPRKVL
jgi:hypothetical protein